MKLIKAFSLVMLLTTIVSCKQENKEVKPKPEKKQPMEKVTTEKPSESLQSILDKRKENFSKKADDYTKKIYKEGLEAVANSGITKSAKQVGDVAPDFMLKNATGASVSLKDYLAEGPVVLTWYRGGWCPYCNLTLQYLQKELPNIKATGASLLALTPELPDNSMKTAEKHALEFEVLSDVGNKVAKDYGVVFQLTEEVAKKYNAKFNLEKYNGDTSNELPLAATYIINPDGKITYAFLDSDYRNRAEPKEILEKLKELK